MRPKLSAFGVLTQLVFLSLLSLSAARPRSHTHHHNERLPRATRTSEIISESSLVANPTNGFCSKFALCLDVDKQLTFPIDSNNVLAHAIAGIPLEGEPCSPNGSVTESSVEVFVPAAPIQTVTLEVREEIRWPGWNHRPYRERVTSTRSGRASTDSTTNAMLCQFSPPTYLRSADPIY